jgi:TRAP-type C4-dicarboxylate transport system permease small subunit
MRFSKAEHAITGGLDIVIKYLSLVACSVLGIMVLLITGSVVLRLFFRAPLAGTVELVELMMVIIAIFAIPYTAVKRSHVRVDLVISRVSKRTGAILGSITFFLGFAIFAAMTYESIINAVSYVQNLNDATSVLFIPFAPFRSILALGLLLTCLVLLTHVFRPLSPEEEHKGGSAK